MSERSKLVAFFLGLEEDSDAFDDYKKNPRREMKRFGLSQSTINAVVKADLRRIRKLLWGRKPRARQIFEIEICVVIPVEKKPRRRRPRSR